MFRVETRLIASLPRILLQSCYFHTGLSRSVGVEGQVQNVEGTKKKYARHPEALNLFQGIQPEGVRSAISL